MRRDEFKLNIIGVGFKDDDDEDDNNDEHAEVKAKKEEDGVSAAAAVADEDGEERKYADDSKPVSADGSIHVKKESMRTPTQRVNEHLLKRFAAAVEGTVFNAHSAIEMLSVFRSRTVLQVTKFRGLLHLSAACQIPVWAYSKTGMQNMPTLKKQSNLAGGAAAAAADGEGGEDGGAGGWRGGGGDDEDGEDGGGGYAGGGGNDATVQMERSYINKLGEREKEVSAEMRVKSFRYGKEQVPFTEEDMEQLKFQTEKGMHILSFMPQKAVPRHHYMSQVDWSDTHANTDPLQVGTSFIAIWTYVSVPYRIFSSDLMFFSVSVSVLWLSLVISLLHSRYLH
jgi:hypothetical protein